MSTPLNPYAPPAAATPVANPNPYAPRSSLPALLYESAAGKARLALFATGAAMVLQLLMAGSCGMQLLMLMQAQQGVAIDQATAEANDARQLAISVILIISALFCLVTLLVWIYAAHSNLPAFGARALEFTPGWAVGYFFIPIVNLWKPYQAVREIYTRSDPGPLVGRVVSSAGILGWWWGLRIISAIVGRVLGAGGSQPTLESLIAMSIGAIIVIVALDLPMLAAQFLIIQRVQRFQDEHYALLQAAAAPAMAANPWAAL